MRGREKMRSRSNHERKEVFSSQFFIRFLQFENYTSISYRKTQMRKSPAFQFYPADYLTDVNVLGFSLEQHGAYLLMLSYDWLNDGIPADIKILSKLLKTEISQSLIDVIDLFNDHPTKVGCITSNRLLRERQKQNDFREQASIAGKRGGRPKIANTTTIETVIEYNEPVKIEETPKKKPTPSTNLIPTIEKYKLPDREGNPRQKLSSFTNIHLSQPEKERILERFHELGFTKAQQKLAIEKVDVWFDENPKKLKSSSEHVTRILDWGVKAVLEVSTTESRATRAKKVEEAPVGKQEFLTAAEKREKAHEELAARIEGGAEINILEKLGISYDEDDKRALKAASERLRNLNK